MFVYVCVCVLCVCGDRMDLRTARSYWDGLTRAKSLFCDSVELMRGLDEEDGDASKRAINMIDTMKDAFLDWGVFYSDVFNASPPAIYDVDIICSVASDLRDVLEEICDDDDKVLLLKSVQKTLKELKAMPWSKASLKYAHLSKCRERHDRQISIQHSMTRICNQLHNLENDGMTGVAAHAIDDDDGITTDADLAHELLQTELRAKQSCENMVHSILRFLNEPVSRRVGRITCSVPHSLDSRLLVLTGDAQLEFVETLRGVASMVRPASIRMRLRDRRGRSIRGLDIFDLGVDPDTEQVDLTPTVERLVDDVITNTTNADTRCYSSVAEHIKRWPACGLARPEEDLVMALTVYRAARFCIPRCQVEAEQLLLHGCMEAIQHMRLVYEPKLRALPAWVGVARVIDLLPPIRSVLNSDMDAALEYVLQEEAMCKESLFLCRDISCDADS